MQRHYHSFRLRNSLPINVSLSSSRFLHDIVTATLNATGFPDGLYEPEELDSKYVKEKAAKIAFLDKFIYLVSVCGGSAINARSSKIVAGLEPYDTNVLLAAFGRIAVDRTFDHAGAIAYCIKGGPIDGFIKAAEQEKMNDVKNDVPKTKTKTKRDIKRKSVTEEKNGEVRAVNTTKQTEEAKATEGLNGSKDREKLNEAPAENNYRKGVLVEETRHHEPTHTTREDIRHKQSSIEEQ
eukprot:364592-Ditylum_brightwellii.AAC.1